MTAAQQVLSTWELLEDILLRAPTKTILMSQRVAQSWRDVIQASHNLQRALFLEPIPGERGNLRIKTQVSQLGLCDVRFTWTSRKGTFCSCGAVEKCVAFNSLLEHVFTLSGSLFRNSKWAREMPKRGIPINSSDIEGFYHIDTPKENPAMRYPEASWRKMFLTQPPCFRVGPISTSPRQSLRCSQYPFNQGLGLVDLTTHESGVTMGHLRDALL
ncbi:hypothetical protein EV356DRAFT_507036 [Viridothelium virens]|uniref:F-box domain-containing protein n=1 Tax=Viridothelium virens TaxID=1048519 RepID=A0A6A6GZU1_VIRVR|nr:hypothetical protein EV356DRAFT_507036 [Viridothelium virens]